MNKQLNHQFSKSRKEHHLLINDLAFILSMDQSNLSRFEAGKLALPKAQAGYHTLFNLSIQNTLGQVFQGGVKTLIDRCFELQERIESGPVTLKNSLRLEGINTIITRLMELEHGGD